MSKDNRNSMEDHFRASQVYKKISQGDETVANQVARGIGKASRFMDEALGTVENVLNPEDRKKYRGGHPYEESRRQNTGPYQPQERKNPPPSGAYHYAPKGQPPRSAVSQQKGNSGRQSPAPENAVRPPIVHPKNVRVKMVRKPSKTKYILTIILAVVFGVIMPLTNVWQFAAYLAAVGGTFLAASALFKGKKKYVAEALDQPNQKEEEPEKTGNSDVDTAIGEGYNYLRRLREADEAIEDEEMSQCIRRIEAASAGIFSYISEHPEKVSQIRKFMNYYLPTTMKLLDSYQRLDAQKVKGENIQSSLRDIDRILYTVASAFENQLDSLFSEEAMDISTDISVFESMLKQEGFVAEGQMPEVEKRNQE